jgi:LEA14-like dessication related protein
MNKASLAKALTLLLSASTLLLPVVYGLSVYGWNVWAAVTPIYSPPRIDFRLEPSGLKLERGRLYAEFKITNMGEVGVVFEGLSAELYGPDGRALAPAKLDRAVASLPGSTETLTIRLELDEAVLNRLASYAAQGMDRIKVEVRGEARIRVFGSRVTAPLSASYELGLRDALQQGPVSGP